MSLHKPRESGDEPFAILANLGSFSMNTTFFGVS